MAAMPGLCTLSFRTLVKRPLVVLAALACAAAGVQAGPALDALDGRWTPTHCGDPATGTWTVLGNQIQFFWPTDSANDALEDVVREESDMVETEVVSPDNLRGRRYRYHLRGRDEVLIENLSNRTQQVVRRCGDRASGR
jgi:hypothetical protein